MTPQARSGAPFELLRFEAAPISGTVVVLELEGRFRPSTRFGRAPVLVVEPGGDQRRVELTPIRAVAGGDHWHASYAAPIEALSPQAHLSLGLRGTLLELPSPDEPDDGERLTALAREANRLRRQLEAAEVDAADARADAARTRAELTAAVTAARDEALARSAERIDALEREVVEAHRLAAADAATARADGEAAIAAAVAETTARHEQAIADATARAEAAELRARDADEQRLAAQDGATEAERRTTEAERRASEAERELSAAQEGIDVLRAELAEERERAQVTIAELEREADAARSGADLPARGEEDEPETRVLRATFGDEQPGDPTRPFTVAEQRDADADATEPFGPREERKAPREATLRDLVTPEHAAPGPSPGRWVALAALVLFAFVLLGLLLGFLP